MKTERNTFLTMFVIAALVMVPVGVYGAEEINGPPPPTPLADRTIATPPVEQALVPEGLFAVQLAEALEMGKVEDEARAENMLSAKGIEPKNGWIAGYPVTPPIIGEIEKGVAGAADSGKLGMGKEQALKAVRDLKVKLGLNVAPGPPPPSAAQVGRSEKPAGSAVYKIIYKYTDKDGFIHYTNQYETIPGEYRGQAEIIKQQVQPQSYEGPVTEGTGEVGSSYAANPSPEVITNYYSTEGPPVVTYYPPPEPYYYLYAWVPYPFWCGGFFFGGFFVLNDFHRHIHFHHHDFLVTNHIVNVTTGKVSVVHPVARSFRGGTEAHHKRVFSFNSPRVRSGARTIVGLSQNRMAPRRVFKAATRSNGTPSHSAGRMVAFRASTEGRRSFTRPTRPDESLTGFRARGPVTVTSPKVGRRQIASPSAGRPPTGQRVFGTPGNLGNRQGMNFERPRAVEPRTFNPRFPSQPFVQGHTFGKPFRGGGGFSRGLRGGIGSFGGFHGGRGFSGRGGFSGGGFGGRR